ncbi:hypothetical protein STEG23_002214, partial [Scotinomys teguina]
MQRDFKGLFRSSEYVLQLSDLPLISPPAPFKAFPISPAPIPSSKETEEKIMIVLGKENQNCSLKNRELDVPASWFLDPGGWSKAASVGLYFIFPGICTLSLLERPLHYSVSHFISQAPLAVVPLCFPDFCVYIMFQAYILWNVLLTFEWAITILYWFSGSRFNNTCLYQVLTK